MVISARIVLACALLASCGASESQVKQPDEKNELRNTDCEWSQETTSQAFNRFAADRALKQAMDRASSCGLHNNDRFDLSFNVSWGHAGCVAWIRLDAELPSDVRECLFRRLESATVPAFSGVSPSARVRVTNDRVSLVWL